MARFNKSKTVTTSTNEKGKSRTTTVVSNTKSSSYTTGGVFTAVMSVLVLLTLLFSFIRFTNTGKQFSFGDLLTLVDSSDIPYVDINDFQVDFQLKAVNSSNLVFDPGEVPSKMDVVWFAVKQAFVQNSNLVKFYNWLVGQINGLDVVINFVLWFFGSVWNCLVFVLYFVKFLFFVP